MKTDRVVPYWCVLALVGVAGGALLIDSLEGTYAATLDSASATYSRGLLHVGIPYQAPHAGAGRLTVDVIDPEDKIVGHSERELAAAARGSWQEDLKLSAPLGMEDLVWHRVHYRFAYDGQKDAAVEGTESISAILRRPVMHILGQQSYLAGGPAAVRVVVTDAKNEPLTGWVRIEQKGRVLYTGRLNNRGTAEAQFRLPAGLVGNLPLHYVAETAIGSTDFTQEVRVEDKSSILLTTEKPLYQPGQTIHVRALALDRANHDATAGRKLTFEVEDSRGNKVFKKATQTDKFGVASAEFPLADEVNLGTYHLRALMDASNSEIAFNVDRYVLPKLKVAVEFSGKNAHGYRPGDHVTGTVRANYFFGKPVDGAEITVKGTGMDVAMFEAGAVKGKTDADGAYRFDLALPAYFAGRPLSQGAARMLVEATVKDSAGHAESRGEPITVSQSPLILTAVPEGGTLVPGIANQVFVLASYADGKPARADLVVRDQKVSTDDGGVAVVRINPTGAETLRIAASDREGNKVTADVPLQARGGSEQVLLRTERAVYRAGDRIALKVFSTKPKGSVYVDVVREGQTVLTRDLDIVNGQAELSLSVTPDLAGTLDLNAYLFGSDARPVADHRLVFVQPADELKIEATADAPVYKPGADARVRFRVTNSRGEGVQVALGLQVVDQAVFALAEKQPGFAKVFFYLEQEVMKPRYEIHSIGMPDVVEPVEQAGAARRDLAARALFAATEMTRANRFETEVGRSVPMAKYADYSNRYHQQFVRQVIAQSPAHLQKIRDAWGTEMDVRPSGNYYLVRSAGPDKQLNTGDDLAGYFEVRKQRTTGNATSGSIDLTIEHDRGPFNGLAEVTGTVLDQTGTAIPGATVSVRAGGRERRAGTGANGQFSIAGLPPGEYQVDVVAPGFRTPARTVTLAARDRAVVASRMTVAINEETIVAESVPRVLKMARFEQAGAMGIQGGVAGGVPGGVMGGTIGGVPMAAPMAMRMELRDDKAANSVTVFKEKDAGGNGGAAATHVRSWFPDALYINPEIVTDASGAASISIPLADSITTWRMAMVASTIHGALGSGTGSLKVFQDFFTDLDLPVTLTQGDKVTLPVAVYNYSGSRGNVNLQLQPADWFALSDGDTGDKTVAVDAGRVGGSQFTIEAKRIGKFKLTLSARMTGRADIVVREIEVIPNGREQTQVFNGRLEASLQHAVNFPAASIPEASKVLVRLYPGPLSQVIEGMDAILRMPGGCFEQTSSSTYPNVLALDYMKRTKKLTPEVHAKAEGFIVNGYQRLLTFEVPGGGFSWFGQAPANKILTSYGLMEFSDMAKVHDVDPKLIQRTQQWLAAQQQPDGSWKPDTQFINEGATNRFNTDVLRITAYIAWSLENTGYQGPAVEKAKQYIEQHMNAKADSYTLAVLANFAADGKDRAFTRQAMQALLDAHTEKDEQAWWTANETGVYATGASASVETTGLAVQALLKWGEAGATATKALSYIASKKDANGTWGTTQATIMALRAVLLSTEKGSADVRGTVEITLNGVTKEKLTLSADNNDLLHQFVFPVDAKTPAQVDLRFTGKGGLAYQVVGRYFLPWNEKPANEPLNITVDYDRTRLAQDDVATATATVKSNMNKVANMVMVDLGIPPGFDLLSEDLQTFQEKTANQKGGRLEKFSMTATQAILYFDSIAPGATVKVSFRLRAKYPIRARTLQSRVYEYYDPDVNSVARPVQLEVRKR